jgi:HEAT repeat protein
VTRRSRAAARLSAAAVLLALAAPATAAGRLSFDDLIANLKSPNAKTRQEAASALGKSRRREAVTPLAALVRDPDGRVRMDVVRALRELRDPAAVPALVTSLSDGEARVRAEAIQALIEVYTERDRPSAVERFLDLFEDDFDPAALPLYVKVEPSVVQALAATLRDEDADIRRAAAEAIGLLGGAAAVEQLTTALQDPDRGVRGEAAVALARVGTSAQGRALIPLLADDAAAVRNRVLWAIGTLRVKDAGPPLREMFEANRRKDQGVRVLSSLARIADPAQAELFRELVQDPDPEKRRLAVEGLGRIADASLLPAFKKDYQRERTEELRLAYSFALTRLGDRAFLDSIVLTLPSRTLGRRARGYVLEMGRDILPDLYPYLTDPSSDVRAALCDLIAAIGDPEAIPRLLPLVNDPSAEVADHANRAVERLRRTSGVASS